MNAMDFGQADSFNRYMVECECLSGGRHWKHYSVLIDTWWNVNLGKSYEQNATAEVLIDTWWNVNENQQLSFLRLTRFNRYMVECELCMSASLRYAKAVLIDTWWNVNTGRHRLMSSADQF